MVMTYTATAGSVAGVITTGIMSTTGIMIITGIMVGGATALRTGTQDPVSMAASSGMGAEVSMAASLGMAASPDMAVAARMVVAAEATVETGQRRRRSYCSRPSALRCQPLRLTDVRPRTPRASTGAGGGGFQKRSDVSFLRVITPRLA